MSTVKPPAPGVVPPSPLRSQSRYLDHVAEESEEGRPRAPVASPLSSKSKRKKAARKKKEASPELDDHFLQDDASEKVVTGETFPVPSPGETEQQDRQIPAESPGGEEWRVCDNLFTAPGGFVGDYSRALERAVIVVEWRESKKSDDELAKKLVLADESGDFFAIPDGFTGSREAALSRMRVKGQWQAAARAQAKIKASMRAHPEDKDKFVAPDGHMGTFEEVAERVKVLNEWAEAKRKEAAAAALVQPAFESVADGFCGTRSEVLTRLGKTFHIYEHVGGKERIAFTGTFGECEAHCRANAKRVGRFMDNSESKVEQNAGASIASSEKLEMMPLEGLFTAPGGFVGYYDDALDRSTIIISWRESKKSDDELAKKLVPSDEGGEIFATPDGFTGSREAALNRMRVKGQ